MFVSIVVTNLIIRPDPLAERRNQLDGHLYDVFSVTQTREENKNLLTDHQELKEIIEKDTHQSLKKKKKKKPVSMG